MPDLIVQTDTYPAETERLRALTELHKQLADSFNQIPLSQTARQGESIGRVLDAIDAITKPMQGVQAPQGSGDYVVPSAPSDQITTMPEQGAVGPANQP